MNEANPPAEDTLGAPSREELMSAMFANMVIQQANMAMMLLGKVAHPETGQFMHDLEAARMFIDQLEMLEVKTKGNLSKQEDGLLKQALSALRMAFVESVDAPAPAGKIVGAEPEHAAEPAPEPPAPAAAAEVKSASPAPAPESPDESRKKFSKKY
jgi:hypothetical protein